MERFDGSTTSDGINNNTYQIMFKDKDITSEDMIKDLIDSVAVDIFTKKRNALDITTLKELKAANYLYENQKQDNFKISINNKNKDSSERYLFESKSEKFTFNKLSNVINFPKEVKRELNSWNRQTKCHFESIRLCYFLENSELVTGRVIGDNYCILHSITVIKCSNGVEYALDYTKNIAMTYEDYKRIYRFVELNRIDRKSIVKDIDSNILKDINYSSKFYCVFRDEIMRDIAKNKEITKKL